MMQQWEPVDESYPPDRTEQDDRIDGGKALQKHLLRMMQQANERQKIKP